MCAVDVLQKSDQPGCGDGEKLADFSRLSEMKKDTFVFWLPGFFKRPG